MKEIREWLASGHDYALGVALYEIHGSSTVILNMLRYGETEFTRQKLKTELEKLLQQEKVHVVDTSVKRVRETPKPVQVAAPPGEADEPSDELRAQRGAWFAERNHLHPQLEACATDAERLAMSLRILKVCELITQSYQAAPDSTAARVSVDVAQVSDAGEIRRLLAARRPQRSKLKKRPDRAADLAQVEADIKILENKLLQS